ncbi:PEP-CTERM sorting domain-containing protein, partial [Planctomycetota bacterium]
RDRMKTYILRFVAVTMAIVTLFTVAWAATLLDDFERPNSSYLGPDWVEQAGDWQIVDGEAVNPAPGIALMTYVGGSGNAISADITHPGGAGTTCYAALVLGYADQNNNLFVKVQDNGGTGAFNRAYFYTDNGYGSWPVSGDAFVNITACTAARISLTLSGLDAILEIDRDFDGVADETHQSTGAVAKVAALGTGIGVAANFGVQIDDFSTGTGLPDVVPESSTLALMLLALVAGVVTVHRRS